MEDSLVEALINGERESKIRAATDLSRLPSKQRNIWAEQGVIPPLVSMLRSLDYDAIEAALFALQSLAFGNKRNKIVITKSGAVPALMELLRCKNGPLIELATAALLMLSVCNANKKAIADSEAIESLIGILSEDEDDEQYSSTQSRLDAIDTLHNLSTCHQVIPLVVEAGVVFTLLRLIRYSDKSSNVTDKAMALLETIASSSETGLAQIARAEGGILALVETVEEGSQQSREHAVAVLLLVCQSCRDEYRGLILGEGAIPGLLQLSVDGTRRAKDMARTLLFLLRDFSDYGLPKRQKENTLFEQIMKEIDAEGVQVNGRETPLVEDMIAKLSM